MPFNQLLNEQLAHSVWNRFSCDAEDASNAWRRLLQNNCNQLQFESLVNAHVAREKYTPSARDISVTHSFLVRGVIQEHDACSSSQSLGDMLDMGETDCVDALYDHAEFLAIAVLKYHANDLYGHGVFDYDISEGVAARLIAQHILEKKEIPSVETFSTLMSPLLDQYFGGNYS
jgi:hypothetical protein